MISPQIRGIMAASRRRTVPVVPPDAPLNLTATPGDEEVLLAWDMVADIIGYKVYYDTDSGAPYANVIDVPRLTLADPANPTYTVTGLTNGTLYYFAVTSYTSEWSYRTTDTGDARTTAAGDRRVTN